MTSDDRIEVAEKLRKGGIARNAKEAYVVILGCIGIRPQLPADMTYQEALSRLADLIDPTCKRVSMDAAGNPPFYSGGLSLNDVKTGCSECGYPFGSGYHRLGNLFNVPNYCPNCGARVVDGDE